ncbi:TetR/AcrR family transcriptional regulator [Pseudocolwellia sp. AS88]|jgi:AcrR family transcriptional regulator|uniref:TetR/AcrR family transcriptional regulator n=1 Tax=Pseudocolwellia TaxID=2848177 RepID=UPI0026EF902E|nr:TetR/AcrR family transcriptional regulator [Pseudocolwellia sp. AS88]MDO7085905.1 TetR/AcrR family transcriptional regulator [Pseudocolwellia sp. AS88]
MRDAEQTRQKILEISADEIHKHGFTATSLSVILKRCEISKGALYHHFTNKIELGYAVFEEIYTPMFLSSWLPAIEQEDPIEGLCEYFSQMSVNLTCDELICGCPLNNLCQEMAGIDEGFRLRILDLQLQLNQLISNGLEKIKHQLRNDINFSQVSYFIVSTFHGSTTLSKSSKNIELFEQVMDELCKYLRNLKQA